MTNFKFYSKAMNSLKISLNKQTVFTLLHPGDMNSLKVYSRDMNSFNFLLQTYEQFKKFNP